MLRELREETGYTSSEAVLLRAGFDGAYSTAVRQMYLAKNCTLSHQQELDEGELVDKVYLVSIDELRKIIKKDEYAYPLLAYLAFEKLGVVM